MSLVGTRPILQDELLKYELHHRARIAIKPGITGMWQVSGRSDITDFEEVVRLDTEYISKVDMINNKKSPIQDEYIEKYLAEKELDLTATLDAKEAYSDADFVVIAAPTNYDSKNCGLTGGRRARVWHGVL